VARRVLLGLDTYSYHFAAPFWAGRPAEPMTLTDYLDRAAELGADGLALADMRHFASTDPETVAAIGARADRLGLYLELGTGGVDFDHLRETLDLSRQLGSKVLRTFVSIGRTWSPPGEYEEALPGVVEALKRAAEACEASGVSLAIENHQDLTSEELAELLDAVGHPMIGVCLDTGNSLGVLEHPLDATRNLADRVLTVHLKSYGVLPAGAGAGYVLVGVPIDHNRELLGEIVALLADRCAAEELHLNLEAAVEVIPVTPGRRGWRAEHAQAAERLLAALPPPDRQALGLWTPDPDISVSNPELLALEDRLVRASVSQARALVAALGVQ